MVNAAKRELSKTTIVPSSYNETARRVLIAMKKRGQVGLVLCFKLFLIFIALYSTFSTVSLVLLVSSFKPFRFEC